MNRVDYNEQGRLQSPKPRVNKKTMNTDHSEQGRLQWAGHTSSTWSASSTGWATAGHRSLPRARLLWKVWTVLQLFLHRCSAIAKVCLQRRPTLSLCAAAASTTTRKGRGMSFSHCSPPCLLLLIVFFQTIGCGIGVYPAHCNLLCWL